MTDGPRNPGQDVLKLSYYYNNNTEVICLFHYIDICTDRAKTMVKETAGDLVETKVVVPNCSSCHFVLCCQDVYHFFKQTNKKQTKTVPFNSVLVENGKNNCTYPHP